MNRRSEAPGEPAEAAQRLVPSEDAEDLYEHAPCGYLSTLPDGTVIKVNQTLLDWTGYRREDLVGRRRFSELLTAGCRIYHETHYAPLLAMQGHAREIALDIVRADGSRVPVLVNSLLVRAPDGEPHVIRTSLFNASDRREYERELLRARERAEASETRARELAQTLQTSLMPPALPDIPGLDLAAGYRPAGAGDEVGGDFYDVFEVGKDDWAIVVGDVCGKGAGAAVLTGLVRYTARAAAIRTRRPSEVLSVVNAALLRHLDERFCTALYLRVRRDRQGRLKVMLSSAGHAVPIRLSAAAPEHVGRSGGLLGVIEDPPLYDSSLVLAPGDALFCYTDGLTEGRRGGDFFGEERLEGVLSRLRGRPGAEVVQAVMDEAIAFQGGEPRDDMAVVFLAALPEPR